MKMKTTLLGVLAVTIGAASAATIGVNFTQAGGNQLIASTTAAGIGGFTNWNNTSGKSGTAGSLVDSDGATTTVSITWNSNNTWGDGNANNDANAGIGDAQLVRGYLDDGNSPAPSFTATVAGLSGTYDVTLYLSTDTEGGLYRPFTINGAEYSTTGTKSRYAPGEGVAHWDATNTITATGLTGDLTIVGLNRDGGNRASVAGLQITAVPEPSAALLGLVGLALVLRRRK